MGERRHQSGVRCLIRQDFNLAPQPSLAEKWDVSADGKVYTFHLVRNAKFHDGKPLTSADVKFTIESIILPYHNQGKDHFGIVDKIETPNSYTIVFRLKRPFAPFMQGLTTDGAPIFPKHLWEGTEIRKNQYGLKPIGSGPFIFKEWARGSHFTLERNPTTGLRTGHIWIALSSGTYLMPTRVCRLLKAANRRHVRILPLQRI